jgi:hypothetical protein
MEGSGATVGVLYPGYHRPLVKVKKSGYGQLPPAANGWETKHLIPDMVPPLLAEEEGPQTKKELDPGMICTGPLSDLNSHGQAGFHHLSTHSRSSS